jgi:hypothetical protein
MSSELLTFLTAVQQEIKNKSYSCIYFDSDTGKIEKITNKLVENETSKYIKILTSEIDDIFTGKKRIEDYTIAYNLQKDSYELIFLNETKIIPYVGDKIYQIPKVAKSKIYSYDLTVRHNNQDKCWNFFVNKNVNQIISKLFFSITAKNDPNILYRTIIVDTKEDCVSFPFLYDIELESEKISVYTNKILNTYAQEVLQ